MRLQAIIVLAPFISFLMIILPATPARAQCPEPSANSFLISGCAEKPTGLYGLFKNKQRADIPLNPGAIPMAEPLDKPIVAVPRKAQRVSLPPQSSSPSDLQNQIIYKSTNGSISEYGTLAPAELHIHCEHSVLQVALNFPGFPMRVGDEATEISYAVNGKGNWRVNFAPSEDFFVVGLWDTTTANAFLSTLHGGNSLRIAAIDAEQTEIRADFDITDLSSKMHEFTPDCRFLG